MPRQTKAATKSTAGKRHPLNMRTTKALRNQLEKAAAKAGRSLAQEVELRLEMSFDPKPSKGYRLIWETLLGNYEWARMETAPKDGQELHLRIELEDGDAMIPGCRWVNGKWERRLLPMPSVSPKAWTYPNDFWGISRSPK